MFLPKQGVEKFLQFLHFVSLNLHPTFSRVGKRESQQRMVFCSPPSKNLTDGSAILLKFVSSFFQQYESYCLSSLRNTLKLLVVGRHFLFLFLSRIELHEFFPINLSVVVAIIVSKFFCKLVNHLNV